MVELYATSPSVDETVNDDGEVGGLNAKEVMAAACLEAGLVGGGGRVLEV